MVLGIREGHTMPYTLWVLDGDDRKWKAYKGINNAKEFVARYDYDELLDEINTKVYPNGTYYNNYIDWVVIPAGEHPKTFDTHRFYGDNGITHKESMSSRSRKSRKLKEANYKYRIVDTETDEIIDTFYDEKSAEDYARQYIRNYATEEDPVAVDCYRIDDEDAQTDYPKYLEDDEYLWTLDSVNGGFFDEACGGKKKRKSKKIKKEGFHRVDMQDYLVNIERDLGEIKRIVRTINVEDDELYDYFKELQRAVGKLDNILVTKYDSDRY